jgi:hypothetical protein
LCTDKPSIGYLEDPIIAEDPDGWIKLKVYWAWVLNF